METTDKKIEEYLERAEKILINYKPDYKLHSNQDTIEIAKMIQLEEHREMPDKQIKKVIDEWNEEAKRFIEGQR